MDEFDSALDPQYCQGIAKLINQMSKAHVDVESGDYWPGCQFFITSFKPHMVSVADKIFEVKF